MAKFVKQTVLRTKIVKKFRVESGSGCKTAKASTSGRKTGFQDTNLAVRIRQFYTRNPNLSECTVANKFGISKTTVHRVKVKAELKTKKCPQGTRRRKEEQNLGQENCTTFSQSLTAALWTTKRIVWPISVKYRPRNSMLLHNEEKLHRNLRPKRLANTPKNF
ncbi:hypothetical protein ILUMI_02111 [Ignelater luminosus]|uniref:Uncharacterized protein n=1 Tax=Ignelater luminosus TaxID=2038154 RepID=A0A8K0GLM4_IGNLU|nr:hypothetical protein ILUMI_02111 [Ignelater luminosus]